MSVSIFASYIRFKFIILQRTPAAVNNFKG